MSTFAVNDEALRLVMAQQGRRAAEVARACQVSERIVQYMAKGTRRTVSVPVARAVARELQVPITVLGSIEEEVA